MHPGPVAHCLTLVLILMGPCWTYPFYFEGIWVEMFFLFVEHLMASKARSLLRSLLRFWESPKIPKMGGIVHPFTDEETKMKKLFQRKKIVCSGSQTRVQGQIQVQGGFSAPFPGQLDRYS